MARRLPEWRLRFVSILFSIIVCVLFYRIIQIQILRHERYAETAKKQWHKKVKWPARRGSIFDRNGYPLAVSHRIFNIGVTPRDFPEDAVSRKFVAGTLGISGKALERLLRSKEMYVPLGRGIDLSGEQEARLSSISGLKLDPGPERLNPLGSLTPMLIGSIDGEGRGNAGLELAFQKYLRGEDGWILVNKDARDNDHRPLNAPGKEPVNGCDLYLTIDSGIQSIVDFELEQAIEKYGAVSGISIVMDPHNGDIVALSEKVSCEAPRNKSESRNTLRSTSCIFEPGSTFKLITDAFLLESGSVDPYDVFYGEKGEAEFEFGTFSDDHPCEWLTFKESFVYSSNICTIKAMLNSDKRDFYSFMLRMGFGGRTGVALPAESKGSLRELKEWSGRSMASISIGQEIGVTALQMITAYSALANGGTLLVPRVALAVRDQGDRVVEDFAPMSLRRVISRETAEVLSDFCRDVVSRGTGTEAMSSGLEVAGKTGTAQKSDGHRYMNGKYVASFIGFAPADEPRLVCLVLLDEPDYRYHYGGLSSAIVFRRIIDGINLSTDMFIDISTSKLAISEHGDKKRSVPNFLRLTITEAEETASENGFRLRFSNTEGEVFSQVPGPGTLSDPGEEICLAFRGDHKKEERYVQVPDLRGLPIRKARRMLLECGLRSKIDGYGIVNRQKPAPGRSARPGSRVTLHCRLGKVRSRGLAGLGSSGELKTTAMRSE